MKCKIDGCCENAHYKKAQLCAKHYHRIWRNGKIETMLEEKIRTKGFSRQYRITMPGKGYQRLYEPGHPLSDSQGYVSEHRKVVYERVGQVLPPCELCGAEINWENCHIDHIDNDVTNNTPENLRPLCRVCNTRRDYPKAHTVKTNHAITYGGVTMTPTEWARQPNVKLSGNSIVRRIKNGATVEEALFGEKKTHNGKKKTDNRKRKTSAKHERKNAISITIGGVTMTSAEWSRHKECNVTDGAIRARVKLGWDPYDAVFRKAHVRSSAKP